MKRMHAYLGSAGAFALCAAAEARETTTYTYDALGRLVAVSTSGGPNSGLNVNTAFDPAGNRSSYAVGTSGAPPPSPPPSPPPPPPPSGNQPPVAHPDSLGAPKCVVRTVNVTTNDTDPEGNYPLALTAVSGPSAWVASSTSVGFETPAVNGTYAITYTVADALGATSTGILTVTVSGSQECQ